MIICVCSAGCLGLIFPEEKPKTIIKSDNVIPTEQPTPVAVVQTLERMTYTMVTPVPFKNEVPVAKPMIISSTGKSGWKPYINYNDDIRVYRPADWEVTTIKSSTLNYELPTGKILEDVIYIRNPSDTGFVMIYGMDFSGTISGTFMKEGEIDNDYYEALINGLVSDDEKAVCTVENIQRDENYYLINNIPARKVSFDLTYKGSSEKLRSDAFLFMKEKKAYMTWYVSLKQSSASDVETAGIIMRSFTMI
jgi:hypothetical protein